MRSRHLKAHFGYIHGYIDTQVYIDRDKHSFIYTRKQSEREFVPDFGDKCVLFGALIRQLIVQKTAPTAVDRVDAGEGEEALCPRAM